MKNILSILLIFISFWAGAQKVSFTLSAPGAVELGESFTVSYTLNQQGSRFKAPVFNDFDYLGGPYSSYSSSMQIINGSMTQSVKNTYSFTLRAVKTGKFTLPAASVTVDGKVYKSNTKTIVVVKGNANAQAGAGSTAQSNQNQGAGVSSQDNLKPATAPQGLVFARTFVSKKNVYVGEPLLVTQKIYSEKQFTGINDFKEPEYTGFWKEDIDLGQLKQDRQAIGNKTYYTVTLKKMILFPQKAGKLTIGSFDVKAVISIIKTRKARDQWEQWMYGNTIRTSQNTNVDVNSPKVVVNVKALPEKGKPANFTGVVGSFSMSASIDKDKVDANDAINLKIKVKGTGNIDLLDVPKPDFPPDFEVYDPKINTKKENTVAGVTGYKSYEYLIIPRNEGSYKLPPVEFSYFDSGKGKYVTLRSDTFKIVVGKGSGGHYVSGSAPVNREDVKFLGKDVRYIRTHVDRWQPKGYHFFNSLWHIGSLIMLTLITIAAVFLSRKIEKERADVVSMRTRKATKVARKRLRSAARLLKEGNDKEFYLEISRVLWGYLSDKFRIPPAELSMENVREKLSDLMDSQTIDEIIAILDKCEFARFSPAGGNSAKQEIYDETMGIISKIEKKLK